MRKFTQESRTKKQGSEGEMPHETQSYYFDSDIRSLDRSREKRKGKNQGFTLGKQKASPNL